MSCDLYAPAIRRYIQWMASAGYCGDGHRFPLDEKSGQYLDALFGVLRKLEPVNEDGYYELWLQAKRGTPEDFGDFEKFRAAGEVESFAEVLPAAALDGDGVILRKGKKSFCRMKRA